MLTSADGLSATMLSSADGLSATYEKKPARQAQDDS
jgi:hypothetical protein